MTGVTSLREALRAFGVQLIEEVETSVATGTFAPRHLADLARIPALTRSWEAFDRVYRRLDADEERRLLRRCLWPALEQTPLADLPPETVDMIAFTLEGDFVGIWPGKAWADRLDAWRRAS